MKGFNFAEGVYKDDAIEIKSRDIASVENFCIDVEGAHLYVVGVRTVNGEWYFDCNCQDEYLKLEKVIVECSKKIRSILQELREEWGACRFFWKKMIYIACDSYGVDYYSYLNPSYNERYDEFYLHGSDAERIRISFFIKYRDKNFMDELYNNYLLLLPQNLSRGIEKEFKERIARDKESVINKYGINFERKNSALEESCREWETAYNEDGLRQQLIGITEEINFWQKVCEKKYDTSNFGITYLDILNNEQKVVKDKYYEKINIFLEKEYGNLEKRKRELISDLRKVTFEEGVNLFKMFQANYRSLIEDAQKVPLKDLSSPYNRYIEFFELGSIQISSTLNDINKFKSKRKVIPQMDLDRALLYFYNTETIVEAQKEKEKQTYLENKKNGTIGEKEVEYALKWLDKDYLIVDKNSIGKYGENTVMLNNPAFLDEPQEYDHIIIGKQGVFLIETKNYAGKLIVDSQGNWIRIRKDGAEEGERNPLQQIRRHEKLLKSILHQSVPIISVICMAHPKMIIEGSENCVIPIVKSDMLVEFIENYTSDKEMTMEDMQECLSTINTYMV